MGELGNCVQHNSELLARLLKEKNIQLAKEIEETVTFRNLGQLRRVRRVYEEPQSVIGNIPGIKLVEMEGNKQYTVCCGVIRWKCVRSLWSLAKARI